MDLQAVPALSPEAILPQLMERAPLAVMLRCEQYIERNRPRDKVITVKPLPVLRLAFSMAYTRFLCLAFLISIVAAQGMNPYCCFPSIRITFTCL